MERSPEPELMNEEEQARAYAQADFTEPHTHCIELLQQSLPNLPQTGTALDLGCGPGDITIRFAKAFSGWNVDGLDGSPMMLKYGVEAVTQARLGDRITLHESYLPGGDAPGDCYDLIFSNSLLHHLAAPMVLWQSIQQWAGPETQVFIMDLMRPDHPEMAHQLVQKYAGNEPDILRRDFYNSLLAAYRIDEIKLQLEQAQLKNLDIKVVSDRHLIVWGYPFA